jgi:hypothetical protein
VKYLFSENGVIESIIFRRQRRSEAYRQRHIGSVGVRRNSASLLAAKENDKHQRSIGRRKAKAGGGNNVAKYGGVSIIMAAE